MIFMNFSFFSFWLVIPPIIPGPFFYTRWTADVFQLVLDALTLLHIPKAAF